MPRSTDDSAARWMGLAVFLCGIGLLALVFVLAYNDLLGAGVLGQLAGPAPAVDAAAALRALAVKGVLLFLMAYVGSAIALRGIGLYAASRAVEP